MIIDGKDFPGVEAKNKLPAEVRERLLTENQWLDRGFFVKPGVEGYTMRSNMCGEKMFVYYLDTQVEPITNATQTCATCGLRQGRFCEVAGDYVSLKHRCSEWC